MHPSMIIEQHIIAGSDAQEIAIVYMVTGNDTIKLQGIQDRVLADNTFLLNNKIRTKQLHSAAYERNGSDCFLSRKPVTCPYNTEGIMSLLDDLHIDLWQSRREVEGKQTP